MDQAVECEIHGGHGRFHQLGSMGNLSRQCTRPQRSLTREKRSSAVRAGTYFRLHRRPATAIMTPPLRALLTASTGSRGSLMHRQRMFLALAVFVLTAASARAA